MQPNMRVRTPFFYRAKNTPIRLIRSLSLYWSSLYWPFWAPCSNPVYKKHLKTPITSGVNPTSRISVWPFKSTQKTINNFTTPTFATPLNIGPMVWEPITASKTKPWFVPIQKRAQIQDNSWAMPPPNGEMAASPVTLALVKQGVATPKTSTSPMSFTRPSTLFTMASTNSPWPSKANSLTPTKPPWSLTGHGTSLGFMPEWGPLPVYQKPSKPRSSVATIGRWI